MSRRKVATDELQLEFDFQNESSATNTNFDNRFVRRMSGNLPEIPEGCDYDILTQVDILFQQIGELKLYGLSALNAFILRSFYVNGKSVMEIFQLLKQGVVGLPSITRARVNMIVANIRDELLLMSDRKLYTKGIVLRKDFVEQVKVYSENHIGHVIKDSQILSNPRLSSIAYFLHNWVVVGDTVIPQIKAQKLFLNRKIDKGQFKTHYAALFHLLKNEVRSMTLEMMLKSIPEQNQWIGGEVNKELVRLILAHDEVFEEVGENSYQLRIEHLNVTQRVARIIFETKDISSANIRRIYIERLNEDFSATRVNKNYPWCVPIGKSKWVYCEDCQRMHMPADIIHDYCLQNVRFRFDDVIEYLSSLGLNLYASSVRAYILKDCRRLKLDKNMFCLTSEVSEAENHLWYSKVKPHTQSRHCAWRDKLEQKIHSLLETSPTHRMPRNDVLKECLNIFEIENVSYKNFYKTLKAWPWLKTIEIDGRVYIEMGR